METKFIKVNEENIITAISNEQQDDFTKVSVPEKWLTYFGTQFNKMKFNSDGTIEPINPNDIETFEQTYANTAEIDSLKTQNTDLKTSNDNYKKQINQIQQTVAYISMNGGNK